MNARFIEDVSRWRECERRENFELYRFVSSNADSFGGCVLSFPITHSLSAAFILVAQTVSVVIQPFMLFDNL